MNVLITETVPASVVLPGHHVWHNDGAYLVDEVSRRMDGVAIAMFLAYDGNPKKVRTIIRCAAEAEVQLLLEPDRIDQLATLVADAIGPAYRTWVAELDMVVPCDGSVLAIDLTKIENVDRVLREIERHHPTAIHDHARLIDRRVEEGRALMETGRALQPLDQLDGLTSRPADNVIELHRRDLPPGTMFGHQQPEVVQSSADMAEGAAAVPAVLLVNDAGNYVCPLSGLLPDECEAAQRLAELPDPHGHIEPNTEPLTEQEAADLGVTDRNPADL